MAEYRLDKGNLRPPKRMADGRIRVDGYLTRTGVFTYINPDGSERRELRTPEEVFHEDSLESFAGVPVTDDHPAAGTVTSLNAKQYMIGAVMENLRRDGEHVAGTIVVHDASTIGKMHRGKVELSCGYTCDLDPTPGVTSTGERYDAIQRNIRGNHVALVEIGRAGPTARVRMDAAVMKIDPVLAEAEAVLRGDAYNPDQPRDESGRFGEGGGSSKGPKVNKELSAANQARSTIKGLGKASQIKAAANAAEAVSHYAPKEHQGTVKAALNAARGKDVQAAKDADNKLREALKSYDGDSDDPGTIAMMAALKAVYAKAYGEVGKSTDSAVTWATQLDRDGVQSAIDKTIADDSDEDGGGSGRKAEAKRSEVELYKKTAEMHREAAAKAKAAGDKATAKNYERTVLQSEKNAALAEREAELEEDHGIVVSVGGDIVERPPGMKVAEAKALLKEYRSRGSEQKVKKTDFDDAMMNLGGAIEFFRLAATQKE